MHIKRKKRERERRREIYFSIGDTNES